MSNRQHLRALMAGPPFLAAADRVIATWVTDTGRELRPTAP
jgi:hypothetical protein